MNESSDPKTQRSKVEIYERLVSLLGKDGVLHTPEELIVYECDGLTLHPGLPDFVVFPQSTEDIVKLSNWLKI